MKKMSYQKLNRKAISCMYMAGLVQLIIIGAIIGAVLVFSKAENMFIIIGGILFGLDLLYVIISPKVRYERYRYLLNDEEIDVIEGFIFTERKIVPIERLHKIAIMKGPIDRIFGLAKIVVTTAGGDVTIRFMEDEEADKIAMSLKNRINKIVLDEKVTNTAVEEEEMANGEE